MVVSKTEGDTDMAFHVFESYYDLNTWQMKPVTQFEEGRLYAAKINSAWRRIQIVQYSPHNPGSVSVSVVFSFFFYNFHFSLQVDVLLTDYGTINTVSGDAVFPLDCMIAAAPRKWMACRLYGVTPFASFTVAHDEALK